MNPGDSRPDLSIHLESILERMVTNFDVATRLSHDLAPLVLSLRARHLHTILACINRIELYRIDLSSQKNKKTESLETNPVSVSAFGLGAGLASSPLQFQILQQAFTPLLSNNSQKQIATSFLPAHREAFLNVQRHAQFAIMQQEQSHNQLQRRSFRPPSTCVSFDGQFGGSRLHVPRLLSSSLSRSRGSHSPSTSFPNTRVRASSYNSHNASAASSQHSRIPDTPRRPLSSVAHKFPLCAASNQKHMSQQVECVSSDLRVRTSSTPRNANVAVEPRFLSKEESAANPELLLSQMFKARLLEYALEDLQSVRKYAVEFADPTTMCVNPEYQLMVVKKDIPVPPVSQKLRSRRYRSSVHSVRATRASKTLMEDNSSSADVESSDFDDDDDFMGHTEFDVENEKSGIESEGMEDDRFVVNSSLSASINENDNDFGKNKVTENAGVTDKVSPNLDSPFPTSQRNSEISNEPLESDDIFLKGETANSQMEKRSEEDDIFDGDQGNNDIFRDVDSNQNEAGHASTIANDPTFGAFHGLSSNSITVQQSSNNINNSVFDDNISQPDLLSEPCQYTFQNTPVMHPNAFRLESTLQQPPSVLNSNFLPLHAPLRLASTASGGRRLLSARKSFSKPYQDQSKLDADGINTNTKNSFTNLRKKIAHRISQFERSTVLREDSHDTTLHVDIAQNGRTTVELSELNLKTSIRAGWVAPKDDPTSLPPAEYFTKSGVQVPVGSIPSSMKIGGSFASELFQIWFLLGCRLQRDAFQMEGDATRTNSNDDNITDDDSDEGKFEKKKSKKHLSKIISFLLKHENTPPEQSVRNARKSAMISLSNRFQLDNLSEVPKMTNKLHSAGEVRGALLANSRMCLERFLLLMDGEGDKRTSHALYLLIQNLAMLWTGVGVACPDAKVLASMCTLYSANQLAKLFSIALKMDCHVRIWVDNNELIKQVTGSLLAHQILLCSEYSYEGGEKNWCIEFMRHLFLLGKIERVPTPLNACARCLKQPTNSQRLRLISCPQCMSIKFCSETCMKEFKIEWHHLECKSSLRGGRITSRQSQY